MDTPIEAKPYVSSITTRYGDVERAKADAAVVNEILGRQGSKFLIDLIAEQCGSVANKFNLDEIERYNLIKALRADIDNALMERL